MPGKKIEGVVAPLLSHSPTKSHPSAMPRLRVHQCNFFAPSALSSWSFYPPSQTFGTYTPIPTDEKSLSWGQSTRLDHPPSPPSPIQNRFSKTPLHEGEKVVARLRKCVFVCVDVCAHVHTHVASPTSCAHSPKEQHRDYLFWACVAWRSVPSKLIGQMSYNTAQTKEKKTIARGSVTTASASFSVQALSGSWDLEKKNTTVHSRACE